MPVIDPKTAPMKKGGIYPAPFDQTVAGREKRRLGDAAGLTQFGVNLVRVPPGTASTLRHWHSHGEDVVYYPGIDLRADPDGAGGYRMVHTDGKPYS